MADCREARGSKASRTHSAEGIVHATVRRHGAGPTEGDTGDDDTHSCRSSFAAEDVDENLEHRLPGWRGERVFEVLNAREQ